MRAREALVPDIQPITESTETWRQRSVRPHQPIVGLPLEVFIKQRLVAGNLLQVLGQVSGRLEILRIDVRITGDVSGQRGVIFAENHRYYVVSEWLEELLADVVLTDTVLGRHVELVPGGKPFHTLVPATFRAGFRTASPVDVDADVLGQLLHVLLAFRRSTALAHRPHNRAVTSGEPNSWPIATRFRFRCSLDPSDDAIGRVEVGIASVGHDDVYVAVEGVQPVAGDWRRFVYHQHLDDAFRQPYRPIAWVDVGVV